jgi:hypothetical protein
LVALACHFNRDLKRDVRPDPAFYDFLTHRELTYPNGGKEDARPFAPLRSPPPNPHPTPDSAIHCTSLGLTAIPKYPRNDFLAFAFLSGNRKA